MTTCCKINTSYLSQTSIYVIFHEWSFLSIICLISNKKFIAERKVNVSLPAKCFKRKFLLSIFNYTFIRDFTIKKS